MMSIFFIAIMGMVALAIGASIVVAILFAAGVIGNRDRGLSAEYGPSRICPHCSKPITEDATFCKHCGKPASLLCPACGQPVKEGSVYCLKCGGKEAEAGDDKSE